VITIAPSALKHGISHERIQYVIDHCGLVSDVAAPPDAKVPDDRILYPGDDAHGIPIEVIALELDDGELVVIHAMKLRDTYMAEYMEALQCRIVP
jgi:hypothetical protein